MESGVLSEMRQEEFLTHYAFTSDPDIIIMSQNNIPDPCKKLKKGE
jgi:hypothetical protein